MTSPQPADTAFGVDPRSERPRGTFSLLATLGSTTYPFYTKHPSECFI